MPNYAYQMEAARLQNAARKTLVGLPQIMATRIQMNQHGVGQAGGSGAINPTPELDEMTGEPLNPDWNFHGWSPDDDIVGSVNLSAVGE